VKLEWPQPLDQKSCLELFCPALQQCVERHPILGCVIDQPETEQPRFRRVGELQLKDHVLLLSGDFGRLEKHDNSGTSSDQQKGLVARALEHVVNTRFPDVRETPPWRLWIAAISTEDISNTAQTSIMVVFNYAHSHGDGMSGLTFLDTFIRALSRTKKDTSTGLAVIPTGDRPLPYPAGPYPISWSYLLSALTREFLPWLPKLQFWKPAPLGPAWTGGPTSFDSSNFRAGLRLVRVPGDALKATLRHCKEQNIKLTGLLHLLIVRGINAGLKERGLTSPAFASSTPVNLRAVFRLPASEMGVNVTAVSHAFPPPPPSDEVSQAELCYARELGHELTRSAATTQDHIVGMLPYAGPLGVWVRGKLGKPRDTTYELSNLMTFALSSSEQSEGEEPGDQRKVVVRSIDYSQPADAVGPPVSFNVVSLNGGDLSVAICWQYGALGLENSEGGVDSAEDSFIEGVVTSIEAGFANWVEAGECSK
jgi:hypothetical protein